MVVEKQNAKLWRAGNNNGEETVTHGFDEGDWASSYAAW